MKTIVLATDFSPVALNAAAYAVNMAATIGADILLFNVYEVIPNFGEITFDVDIDDLTKTAEIQIAKFRADVLQQTSTVAIIKTEIRIGVFNDELMKVCERINPYAVVMGSQGKSEAEHFFMGSHAGKAIDNFTWPIITVPPTATYANIKKIGIAYDFEEPIEEDLITDIKFIAHDFNVSFDILNAAHHNEFHDNFIFLSRMLEYSLKPFTVKYHFLVSDNIEEGILKFVDDNNIDMLIVIPKQHNLFQKIFHKSHSKQLVLHSHVPVLLLNK